MSIHSRVTWTDYQAVPALSISRLKELKRSPLHYRYRLEHPKESKPLTLGTAAHCATLEPELFAKRFAVWDRRTESGRAAPRNGKAWDAFVAQAPEKTILTGDEYALATGIAAAVREDPVAFKYIETGDPEVTLDWELGERACKGRIDWLTVLEGDPVLVGLKSARDARPFQFGAAAARYGYHLQWAFYFDGYRAITGKTPRMIEIVVESAPPHAVVVYFIDEANVLQQGRDEYLELVQVLERCERLDEWPGPAATEQALTLPSWVYPGVDDLADLDLEGTP